MNKMHVIRRRTQDERREETRERLLTAAVKILHKRGYANFRFAEVSDVSGVSRGGMIHHYPSKDELVAGVLEYLSNRLQQRAKSQIDAVHDIDSALEAIIESASDFFFGHDFPIYLDLVMASTQGGSLPKTARSAARRHSDTILDVWTKAFTAHGLDETTARAVVDMIWTLMRGLAIKAIGNPDSENRPQTIKFALEMVRSFLTQRVETIGNN
jgi:AcrR family transcriptional regulator